MDGVGARTFHSAALGLLHRYSPEPPRRILSSKALVLRRIGNRLPRPYRFRPAADLATEVEWAKNRRLDPATYASALDGREPPIPADLMAGGVPRLRALEGARGLRDFEDVLERAITLLHDDDHALADLRDRYRAFTVDEYQDVNLLQQTLLDLWLGTRDELCAVGDDYQSIYGFTGATPEHLLGLPARFPHALVVRLEANYRSTPEILGLANRLTPTLGGAEKRLRATARKGRDPTCAASTDEAGCVADWARSTPTASPTRRWRCSCGQTPARSTSRAPSSTPGSRTRARRSSSATPPASC